MLSSAGRRYRDVIPSYPGDQDGLADVLWYVPMNVMSRLTRCDDEHMCGTDFVTKSTLFAPSGWTLCAPVGEVPRYDTVVSW